MHADGHIHTPFCPHGTKDALEDYINWFVERNVGEITFAEHAPLPEGFKDTTPTKDSGMDREILPLYLETIRSLKKKYENIIRINIGLEIDYIEGYEDGTAAFLNEYGPLLDDSILSVHFLKHQDIYYCLDFSVDYFGKIAETFGSVEQVHEAYYHTLAKSVKSNLGPYKPKRIGHMTLVRKFQHKYPVSHSFGVQINRILEEIKLQGLALDYNGAGTAKPHCLETYPDYDTVEKAIGMGIPLVYGSDAHQVKDLGQGFSSLHPKAGLLKPSAILARS